MVSHLWYPSLLHIGIIVLLFLAACSPAPSNPPMSSAEPASAIRSVQVPPQAAGQPQRGGVFVFAIPGNFANCNAYDVNDRQTNMVLDHVYETLVRYDYNQKDYRANFDVVPWLAERWEQTDPVTWVFHLRSTTWHDGQPFGADDVVATYQLLKERNYTAYGNWRTFRSVEKVDDHTVKFMLNQPVAEWQLMANLGEPSNAHILPKHIIDAGRLDTACIGTGPFKIKSIEPNSKAVMVRNENYWREDASGQQQPYLDGIEIIFGMDRSAMQGAFAAGELDLIPLTTWPEVEVLTKQVPGAQVHIWPAHWSHGLVLNFGRLPFSDKRVRQAVNLLIDRQQIIDTVFFGKGFISLPISPSVREGWGLSQEEALKLPGFRPDKSADIAQARSLLAEAGYGPGGRKLTFELLYARNWAVAPMVDFLAGFLKSYDIEVQLRGVDSATFARDRRDGKYDAALWHLASPDPFLRPQQNWYTRSPDAQGAKIPDLGQDRLLDELRVTTDVTQQKAIILQLQKLALDEVFGIALADPPSFAVTQPWVNGYRSSLSVQAEVTGSAHQLWFDQSKLPAKRKR